MQLVPKFIGLALIVCVCAIVLQTSGVSYTIFVNKAGLALVVLGTMASLFISYSLKDLKKIVFLMTQVFLRKDEKSKEVAKKLLHFCQNHRPQDISDTTKQEVHPFLHDALILMSDGYKTDEIHRVLSQRIETFWNRELQDIDILKVISKYPPAFGMIGTVTGLIALMSRIGGSSDMSQTGIAMAIALTTTLYGLAFSNFFLKPVADNIELRSQQNTLKRTMIMKTVLIFKEGASILVIQDTINSFLTSSEKIDILSQSKEKNVA